MAPDGTVQCAVGKVNLPACGGACQVDGVQVCGGERLSRLGPKWVWVVRQGRARLGKNGLPASCKGWGRATHLELEGHRDQI